MLRHLGLSFILLLTIVEGASPAGEARVPVGSGQIPVKNHALSKSEKVHVSELEEILVLNLLTAQRVALQKNPSIEAAADRFRQAQARVRQALSTYWPRIDAYVSGERQWLSDTIILQNKSLSDLLEGIDPRIRFDSDDATNYFEANLIATWLLFDGFAREFSVAASRFGKQAAKEAVLDAQRLLLSSVASSYHNAQLARQAIIIAEADEAFNLRQLKEAKARYRVGTGSLSDVLNFEVQANSAKTQLLNANREYKVFLIGLAALMGLPEASLPGNLEPTMLEPEVPEELVTPEPAQLIEYARKNRSDILQGIQLVEQAQARVGIVRGEFFPKVELFASADGERTDDPAFKEEDFGYSIGARVSYNLFEGGVTQARVREVRAGVAETKNNLQDLSINVASEVRRAVSELKTAQEQLLLQRENVTLAEQNRDLVDKEYTAGQASLERLNEAQRDLVVAQSRLARALVSLRQAWQDLKTSTGEILIPFADARKPIGSE